MGLFDFFDGLGDEIDPLMSNEKKQERKEEREERKRQWEEEDRDLYYARLGASEQDDSRDSYENEHIYRDNSSTVRRKKRFRINCCFILAVIAGIPFCMPLVSLVFGPFLNNLVEWLTKLGFYNLF